MLLGRISLLFLLAVAAPAQVQVQNWWNANSESPSETGKLQDLKDKRRVFLNITFTSSDPQVNVQQEQATIRRLVTLALATHKEFQIVPNPEGAEFVVSITASQSVDSAQSTLGNFSVSLDPGLQTPLDVTVVLRGALQRNGTYRPRVVWEMSSPNVHGEPGPAAVFAVDGFTRQLKKVLGEK